MFNECGKKIQKIAKILFIIGMILSILWLLISFSAGDIEGISAINIFIGNLFNFSISFLWFRDISRKC